MTDGNHYKTLDQWWKIDDEQLKTPEHDDLLIWLLKKENLKKIITKKDPEAIHWDWENVKIHAEEYIIAENGYRVGAPDIIFSIPRYSSDKCQTNPINKNISPNCVMNAGYNSHDHYQHYSRYFIEIKPEIKNFGTTLRQLKLYISYGYEGRAYLLTADQRFIEEFENQGIKVIYPPKVQTNLEF
ncbi:MAG: hypothetical protein B655_1900 [Methanobacterium sp. Maddingley MBC34]|nr:MAG: hypothetical protein B655_1900 [Methanobacterium sp. Maddingley MBC34]